MIAIVTVAASMAIAINLTHAFAADASSQLSLPSAVATNISLTGGPHNWAGCTLINGVPQSDCLLNHPWNSLDWQPADGKVYASHGGTAHINDCRAVNGHRSFVRIDYNDGSGYQVSYEHVHNVDLQIIEGQWVQRGQYLGTISTDSYCGGTADAPHTHMSLWNFTGGFTASNNQALDLNGVQIAGWVLDDGSPTPTQYTGCITAAAGGARQCPTATIVNDGTIPGVASDLYFIKTVGTGSGYVEVHSGTAASGYQIGQHAVSRFSLSDAGNGSWNMAGTDLWFVKTANTSSGRVEVHSATGGSGYGSGTDYATRFSLADVGLGTWQVSGYDLYFIKWIQTGSGFVEVHSATYASGYQSGVDLVSRFTIADRGNGNWFMSGSDLWFIKLSQTGSGQIETHSAPVSSGYQSGLDYATRFSVSDSYNGWWNISGSTLWFTKTWSASSGHVEVHSATLSSSYNGGQDLATYFSLADATSGTWQVD